MVKEAGTRGNFCSEVWKNALYSPPPLGYDDDMSENTRFSRFLSSGEMVVTDGPFGTQLQAHGLTPGQCPEEWNLSHPEVVKSILARYKDAGSQVAKTNSFGGSRLKLRRFGVEEKVYEINRAAAALAREVSGPERLVLGCMGPTGEMVEPYGDVEEDELYEVFAEQAKALQEGGVDALLVETQPILEECCVAIRAAKEATGLPVVASFTFDALATGGYASMMGVRPPAFAEAALEAGAAVIGSNCSTGPDHMVNVIRALRDALPEGFPLIAMPNAGIPHLEKGVTVFPETPESMAEKCLAFRDLGVRMVGGCCGNTEKHIAALVRAFRG